MHRTLARLFHDRGVKMLKTSQLNVGGNMDFYNMLERERLESKKISKTNAVTSIMGHELPKDDVYIGPSDYVPWLTDRKWAHIRLEGQAFGDVPLNVELKLEVWDSPNSAGIVIDAVRLCKLGLNHGLSGQLDGPSSYLMKSPKSQRPDDEAREATEKFIAKYAGKASPAAKRASEGRREEGRAGEARRPGLIHRFGHRRPASAGRPPVPAARADSVPAVPEHAAALRSPARLPRAHVVVLAERLAGLTASVREPDDLPALPLSTKAELRADQAAHPPFGARLCAPREASCGST